VGYTERRDLEYIVAVAHRKSDRHLLFRVPIKVMRINLAVESIRADNDFKRMGKTAFQRVCDQIQLAGIRRKTAGGEFDGKIAAVCAVLSDLERSIARSVGAA
jgi:hypothetical protein